MKKKVILFVLIPVTFNLFFFGLYFSGVDWLQQLVAPRMTDAIPVSSWREFGVVEQLQNIFLLYIVIVFLVAAVKRKCIIEKVVFAAGFFLMLFLFLEEIDYGLHFWHYFIDSPSEVSRFNWHNQHTFSNHENGRYLRKLGDLVIVCWFLLLPLLSYRFNFQRVKSVIPSPWFIATLIVSFLCTSLAHYLDDQGMGMINGRPGILDGNVSEFRETTTYYLYLLYALQLTKTTDLISKKAEKVTNLEECR